jgi:hypothetical protein
MSPPSKTKNAAYNEAFSKFLLSNKVRLPRCNSFTGKHHVSTFTCTHMMHQSPRLLNEKLTELWPAPVLAIATISQALDSALPVYRLNVGLEVAQKRTLFESS